MQILRKLSDAARELPHCILGLWHVTCFCDPVALWDDVTHFYCS